MQLDLGQLDIRKIAYNSFFYFFIAIFIGISQSAGIGGGPILNITLMVAIGYSTKKSMAITYLYLLGGSCASFYSSYGKKLSKTSNINLINYDLVLLTMPMTLSGTMFGTIFNHFSSQLLITILFTFLLVFLTRSSYQKYKQVSQESLREQLLKPSELIQIQMGQMKNQPKISRRLIKIIQQENKPYPVEKVQIILYIIGFTILVILMKGSRSMNSIIGLQSCGLGTWLCLFIHFAFCYYVTVDIANKKERLNEKKQKLGYVFKENQKIQSSFNSMVMALGFGGGFAGGLLGLGGAIILVPGWLQMGINRNVAVSTSPPLIFCSAFISMTVAFLCGYYTSILQVLFHLSLGFVSSFYIKKFIVYIKQLYKLQGMIFLLLMLVMILSLVVLLPYSFIHFINDPQAFLQFDELC